MTMYASILAGSQHFYNSSCFLGATLTTFIFLYTKIKTTKTKQTKKENVWWLAAPVQ